MISNDKIAELLTVLMTQRQKGRTTAICKGAKEVGAIVVLPNTYMTKELSKHHGVKAISISNDLRGYFEPLILDHYTYEVIIRQLLDENLYLSGFNKALHICLGNFDHENSDLKRESKALKLKMANIGEILAHEHKEEV